MRIALGVEYDGGAFRGWQRQQPGVRTIQECLERAIARVADQPIETVCAGRTDAGVHAWGQVVHFDTSAERPPRAWILGCNSYLPDDVSVTWARAMPVTFHARFSALARRYRYQILNRPSRSALLGRRWTWVYRPLALAPMQQAARAFLGEHDFSSFRAAECQAKSPVRRVEQILLWQQGEAIVLEIEANAFLHHMVRNIVGVLLAIGSGERPVAWAGEVLAARDRRCAGVTAPPQGLCLLQVRYNSAFPVPAPGSLALASDAP